MPRRQRNAISSPLMVPGAVVPPDADGQLEKQSCYGREPWKPGEIPTRAGSRITAYGNFDSREPYGQFLQVERPTPHGKGKPDEKGGL